MNLFNDIQFIEDTHTYILDGKIIPSMSSKIDLLYKKFDSAFIAPLSAAKHKTTESIILSRWESAKDLGIEIGNDSHSYGEHGGTKYTLFREAINQYLLDLPAHYKIVGKELRLYSRIYWVAGTCDLLLYNTLTGKYIIADYKSNKNLFKTFNDDLYSPFEQYINNPFNKYIVQLNGYQLMLEEAGLEVEARHLIWVSRRCNHSLYTHYKLPNENENIKIHFKNTRH